MSGAPSPALRTALAGAGQRLVVALGRDHRCVSSAVLGGGLGWLRTWLDPEVARSYARSDPARHLQEESADLAAPVVGMLTAAAVASYRQAAVGGARAVATVGVGHPLAAAGSRPRARMPFAGPVTRVGADLARAVLEAVCSGAELARRETAAGLTAR